MPHQRHLKHYRRLKKKNVNKENHSKKSDHFNLSLFKPNCPQHTRKDLTDKMNYLRQLKMMLRLQ